jgi:uncharacterized protein (TIGR02001 family)
MWPGVIAGFRAGMLAIATGLPLFPAVARGEGSLGGLVAGTTDYVFRGISQTRGEPAAQGGIHYQTDGGWFMGAWASTVDPNPGPGPTAEINLFGGHGWQLGSAMNARLTYVHYMYAGDSPYLDYDYDELIGSIGYRDMLVASVSWSPNTSRYSGYSVARDKTTYSFDLVGRWTLHGPVAVIGGVGYYDLNDLFGTGYTYGSLGLACSFEHLELDAAYYSTSGKAEDLFGPQVAGSRWSVTAAWRF